MKPYIRRAPLALALLVPLVACSGSSPSEGAKSGTSALDPSNVIPPTRYTLTMWVEAKKMLDATANGPTYNSSTSQLAPSVPGESCWDSHAGLCQDDPTVGSSGCLYDCWTPDTGYQFWGEIAASVGGGNADYSSCLMSTPGNLGHDSLPNYNGGPVPPGPWGANVTACGGDAQQNGGGNGALLSPGSPLSLKVVTTDPGQSVQVAMVVDNAESVQAPNIQPTQATDYLQQGLSAGGTAASVGAFILTGTEAASVVSGFGPVFATLGSIYTAYKSMFTPPAGTATPGQEITCAGAMFDPSWPRDAVESESDPALTDTLSVTITAAQLDAMANQNIELRFEGGAQWGRPSDPEFSSEAHCSSDIVIHLTAQRDWAFGGLAAAPRSGDFAVVSAPGQEDVMVVAQSQFISPYGPTYNGDTPNQWLRYWGNGTSWSGQTTDGYPVYSAIAGESVNASTTGAIVQLPAMANGGDEVFLYADTAGSLHENLFPHTDTGSQDFAYGKVIFDKRWIPVCRPGIRCMMPRNYLTPNAKIAAVSRTAQNVDAFFIDTFGNLWNVYSYDAGNTWGAVQVTSDNAGVPGGPVSAIAQTATSLDVFYLGSKGLEHASWVPGPPWTWGPVGGTSGLATAGAPLSAVASSTSNWDVFFLGTTGTLWRVWQEVPQQPTPRVTAVVSSGSVDGIPGGAIAAVARQPDRAGIQDGTVDVVFQGSVTYPEWYELTNGTLTDKESLSDVPWSANSLSLVAPSSYELRAFAIDSLNNVTTADWVASGQALWTSWSPVEELTKPTIHICTTCPHPTPLP